MSNNKNRGSNYERSKRLELIKLGYSDIQTTRNESRSLDAAGVDLVGHSMPFYVQCKLSNGRQFNHHAWYMEREEMLPKDKPTFVFNKVTSKSNAGRFLKEGEYVTMKIEEFYKLIDES